MSASRPSGPRLPLAMILAVPEPVDLGGRTYFVAEHRLHDQATLERALGRLVPHPLTNLPPADVDPEPATRKRRLREARIAAEAWPPVWGSPEFLRALMTIQGAASYLRVTLGRFNEIDDATALELAGAMTTAEWADLDRITSGLDPLEAVYHEADPATLDPGDNEPPDWGEIFGALAARGIMPEQAGDLTVRQLRVVLGDDRRFRLATVTPTSGADLIEAHRRGLLAWHEDDEIVQAPSGWWVTRAALAEAERPKADPT